MAVACRFAAPLGLAPLPRGRAVAKGIAFSVGSAKAVPRGVAMKAANGTPGGEETPETVGPLCCTGVETSGPHSDKDLKRNMNLLQQLGILPCGATAWLSFAQSAQSSEGAKLNMVYEVGELFELGIQLSYLLILLGLLGTGTFYVIRQVLVRRELDLSAKDLQFCYCSHFPSVMPLGPQQAWCYRLLSDRYKRVQEEQVRSGEGSATELFELGAVMLRRKFYPAAIKYLQQAIQKWDRDEQDLAQSYRDDQVYNALGVSYKRENKLDKAIKQFEKAVELQPGYVTAWNNLGDAYEQQKDLASALRAFEEVLLFDPNNKVARPRRDDLKSRVGMYKGVPVKTTDKR
ncbi:Uncharacterized protein ycf37 [Triticum urartu]|uniref:Uncharacterized protein ycf37 n=1 Tax=Triticum urartu TaxID=4572 RepID=M7ZV71_TRIUA|nr:Uncharacterized protein ycf37 [Triticum urartu]